MFNRLLSRLPRTPGWFATYLIVLMLAIIAVQLGIASFMFRSANEAMKERSGGAHDENYEDPGEAFARWKANYLSVQEIEAQTPERSFARTVELAQDLSNKQVGLVAKSLEEYLEKVKSTVLQGEPGIKTLDSLQSDGESATGYAADLLELNLRFASPREATEEEQTEAKKDIQHAIRREAGRYRKAEYARYNAIGSYLKTWQSQDSAIAEKRIALLYWRAWYAQQSVRYFNPSKPKDSYQDLLRRLKEIGVL